MGFYFSKVYLHNFTMKNVLLTKKQIAIVFLLSVSILSHSQNLRIYHIDVDQADATLIITPNGSTLLVDAGKNGHGPRIERILRQENITRIDHFVNTHYHEDHYGGIDDLVNDTVTIGLAYDRGDKDFLPANKLRENTYIDYNNAVGRRAITLTRGMQLPVDNTISVTCISQGGTVLGEQNPTTALDENDMSLSLLISYGHFRYFVGGDIEGHTESKIADRDLVLDIDVYQANHHGSHTSSSPDFMQDLMPTVVVISNGSNDRYYHPRQVTLNTFNQLAYSPTVFQTNKYLGSRPQAGNVNDDFIADLDTEGDDGTILIEVDLSQNNYTVAYRGLSRNFSIKNRGETEIQPNQVIIERLMPDPIGADITHESVTIRNTTTSTVPLTGWTLRDASSRIWPLGSFGQIPPNQSLTIQRNSMPMSLNNDGDIITLLNANNIVMDELRYVGSVEGVAVAAGN
jgi:competence protein ComEC